MITSLQEFAQQTHNYQCRTGTVSSGPAPNKRGTFGLCPRVWRGVVTDLSNTDTCPIRGLCDQATMAVEQGGGGGRKRTGTGDVKTAGRTARPKVAALVRRGTRWHLV